jgi:hypothetical protein
VTLTDCTGIFQTGGSPAHGLGGPGLAVVGRPIGTSNCAPELATGLELAGIFDKKPEGDICTFDSDCQGNLVCIYKNDDLFRSCMDPVAAWDVVNPNNPSNLFNPEGDGSSDSARNAEAPAAATQAPAKKQTGLSIALMVTGVVVLVLGVTLYNDRQ